MLIIRVIALKLFKLNLVNPTQLPKLDSIFFANAKSELWMILAPDLL